MIAPQLPDIIRGLARQEGSKPLMDIHYTILHKIWQSSTLKVYKIKSTYLYAVLKLGHKLTQPLQ